MDIAEKQDKIKKKKGLALYEPEVLKYLDTSCIAKTLYKGDESSDDESSEEEVQDVPYWKKRIKCNICGKEYFRSGGTKHKRTQYHQIYASMSDKLRKFILE